MSIQALNRGRLFKQGAVTTATSTVMPMTQLHKIMYSSSATKLLNEAELEAIMLKSRHKNAHFSVTGCLLYHDGNIIQYLEGSKSAVEFIYGCIRNDKRHTGIHLLCHDAEAKRAFSDWAMALRCIPHGKLHQYSTVYNLFEDMMETRIVDNLCRPARVFFETFLAVSRLRSGNMGLN